MKNTPIHQPKPHDSAHKHVSGQSVYIDDIAEPSGCLHGALGLSEIAHGKILNMDLAPVRAAEGVVAVYTVDDVKGAWDIGAMHLGDEPILARGEIMYHAQPIFLVVAHTREAARRAAKLANVRYEDFPAALTIDQALAQKTGIVTEGATFERKDKTSPAPHSLKGTMRIGGQEHFYLEGQIAMAEPREDGGVFVHSSSQSPSEVQHMISQVLNIPKNKVEVEVRRMGGGFGGKETQPAIYAALASMAATDLGRAVKIRLDRDDDMATTGKRHDFRIDYSAQFDDDGLVSSVDADLYARCGYAADLSGAVTDRALLHADNAYYYPNVRLTSHPLKTHTVSNTAYRGFGGPQGMMLAERLMEDIARVRDLDPFDVRMRNLYGARGNMTPYHQEVKDNIAPRLMMELAEACDYKARRREITTYNAANRFTKKGIALTPVKFGISFTATFFNQAGAVVNVYQDGTVQVNHGGTEMGQGLNIKVAQIAADCLGIDLDQIIITPTNTSKVPNTSATAASSGTDLNGMAVQDACQKIRARIDAHLNEKHGDGADKVSWQDAVQSAYFDRVQLSATGFYKTPDIGWDRDAGRGTPFYYFSYGAACSEVTVDRLTGDYVIDRTDILHDVGKSINPAIDMGQVEGAFVQGMGWLTREELNWDNKGKLRTHNPSTYKIPLASDIPRVFNTKLVSWAENYRPTIRRSKAVGEPPFMLAMSVFFALDQAVGSVGDQMKPTELEAPATPERILLAMDARDGGI